MGYCTETLYAKADLGIVSFFCLLTLIFAEPGYTQDTLAPANAPESESVLMISEIMADNLTFADEDGDLSDWIEIYNSSMEPVSLFGWYLTDNPRDLKQWKFPDISIPAGGRLVVFASGKNRIDPSGNLHTNFSLSTSGEYLALVEPDGLTIKHEFTPHFPEQKPGFSYGRREEVETLISAGMVAKVFVPEDASLEAQWIDPTFDDSSWASAKTGIGFDTQSGRFLAETFFSKTQIRNLAAADSLISDPSRQSRMVSREIDIINFLETGPDGNYTESNQTFPGLGTGVDASDYAVRVTGQIIIPETGVWTFGINSDDGARLRIDGEDVIVDNLTHSPHDTFGFIVLTEGAHDLELVYFERDGGAELELFAAPGHHSAFDADIFRLVGDIKNGGIGPSGFGWMIAGDLEEEMKGKNASVYLRLPFLLNDLSSNMEFLFSIQYNDGFIAYLNGQEFARRNAPDIVEWNSSATGSLSSGQSIQEEKLIVESATTLLRSGTNVLAIHGLNANAVDDNFFILPEFEAAKILAYEERYFSEPSPGAVNGKGAVSFAGPTQCSRERGFYDGFFDLTITVEDEEAVIRYTTDGSPPTETNGEIYQEPIRIDSTTLLRAAAFKPDHYPSNIETHTYIFLDDILQQTRPDGYPTRWGNNVSADYDMDPEIVNHELYKYTIQNDLLTIPSLSIVTNRDDLFDPSTGIYTNPTKKGEEWERPTSVEFIYPDERAGFQIDCGIQIQGGYSRLPDRRKHSFRLLFKKRYGPAQLIYPLFDDSPVDRFDTITLRGSYNYSWHSQEGGFGSTIGKAEYIRDEFSRKTQLALGQPASHGTYMHLYLNGLYWGLYNICERPDEAFSAEHLGGEKDEWDVVTGGTRDYNNVQVKAGNNIAWDQMITLVNAGGFEDDTQYQAIQDFVDIDGLIDYMLTIYFTGNRDAPTVIGGGGTPWNFYSSRLRKPGEGYHFYAWDSEWTLEENDRNVIEFHNGRDNPAHVFQQLRQNKEFLIRVADRIHHHFFNEGALTAQASQERYRKLAAYIDRAIVGESARWGDTGRNTPRTRDEHWLPEINRILNEYLSVRTDIVLNQLRQANLYPTIPAPEFNHNGGLTQVGFPLTMTSKAPSFTTVSFIAIDDTWKYEQSGTNLGIRWKMEAYNDEGWPSGKALFYVESSDLNAEKNTPLELGQTTYYFRKRFTIPTEIDLKQTKLTLRLFVDDGAVVYLNDQEVYRIGMPDGVIRYTDFANRTVGDADFEGPFEIPVNVLTTGENLIAVEVHQTNATSSDIVFGLTLDAEIPIDGNEEYPIYYTLDGSDPRLPGGALNEETAIQYKQAVPITQNVQIRARAYDGSNWSALSEAEFITGESSSEITILRKYLQVTELMYNPPDGGAFEYIELHNSHDTLALDLSGAAFTEGIDYVFEPDTLVPAGAYLLVINAEVGREQDVFRNHYELNGSASIVGPYKKNLSNEGEELILTASDEVSVIVSLEYNDARGWPIAADGAGHSLIPLDTAVRSQPEGSLYYGGNWKASQTIGGSPGDEEPFSIDNLVLNELAANEGENDWIEIYNQSPAPIGMNGWYLSDDPSELNKWRFLTTDIAANGFASFDREAFLYNTTLSSIDSEHDGFELDEWGGELYLSYLPGIKGIDRVVDTARYKAQETGVSLGRYADGNTFWHTMNPSRNIENNAGPPHIVMNEIMYAPLDGDDNGFEYIELSNPTDQPIELWNENGSWRLAGGIDFSFPPQTLIPSHDYCLIVNFLPAQALSLKAFKNTYGLDSIQAPIIGPYDGKLSNRGERIALEKPVYVDAVGVAWGIVDEVIYFDKDPWPSGADRSGLSLQRISAQRSGNDPTNWTAETPTPGFQEGETPVDVWMVY